MQDFIKQFVTIDLVIVLILGIALFFIAPDLQAQVVAGFIGYLGGKTVRKEV